jgi:spastin
MDCSLHFLCSQPLNVGVHHPACGHGAPFASGIGYSSKGDPFSCDRELGQAVNTVSADQVRPIGLRDFSIALQSIRPSVSREQLSKYEKWTQEYGMHS